MKSASQLVQTAEPGGGADTFMGPAGTTAHVTRPSSARLSAGAQSFAAPSQLLEDLSISASNASKQQLLRDAAREVLDLNAIPSPKGGSGPQNGASRAPRNSLPPLPASAGVSLHDVGRHTPPFGWEGAQAGQHHTTAARPLSASRSGRQQVFSPEQQQAAAHALEQLQQLRPSLSLEALHLKLLARMHRAQLPPQGQGQGQGQGLQGNGVPELAWNCLPSIHQDAAEADAAHAAARALFHTAGSPGEAWGRLAGALAHELALPDAEAAAAMGTVARKAAGSQEPAGETAPGLSWTPGTHPRRLQELRQAVGRRLRELSVEQQAALGGIEGYQDRALPASYLQLVGQALLHACGLQLPLLLQLPDAVPPWLLRMLLARPFAEAVGQCLRFMVANADAQTEEVRLVVDGDQGPAAAVPVGPATPAAPPPVNSQSVDRFVRSLVSVFRDVSDFEAGLQRILSQLGNSDGAAGTGSNITTAQPAHVQQQPTHAALSADSREPQQQPLAAAGFRDGACGGPGRQASQAGAEALSLRCLAALRAEVSQEVGELRETIEQRLVAAAEEMLAGGKRLQSDIGVLVLDVLWPEPDAAQVAQRPGPALTGHRSASGLPGEGAGQADGRRPLRVNAAAEKLLSYAAWLQSRAIHVPKPVQMFLCSAGLRCLSVLMEQLLPAREAQQQQLNSAGTAPAEGTGAAPPCAPGSASSAGSTLGPWSTSSLPGMMLSYSAACCVRRQLQAFPAGHLLGQVAACAGGREQQVQLLALLQRHGECMAQADNLVGALQRHVASAHAAALQQVLLASVDAMPWGHYRRPTRRGRAAGPAARLWHVSLLRLAHHAARCASPWASEAILGQVLHEGLQRWSQRLLQLAPSEQLLPELLGDAVHVVASAFLLTQPIRVEASALVDPEPQPDTSAAAGSGGSKKDGGSGSIGGRLRRWSLSGFTSPEKRPARTDASTTSTASAPAGSSGSSGSAAGVGGSLPVGPGTGEGSAGVGVVSPHGVQLQIADATADAAAACARELLTRAALLWVPGEQLAGLAARAGLVPGGPDVEVQDDMARPAAGHMGADANGAAPDRWSWLTGEVVGLLSAEAAACCRLRSPTFLPTEHMHVGDRMAREEHRDAWRRQPPAQGQAWEVCLGQLAEAAGAHRLRDALPRRRELLPPVEGLAPGDPKGHAAVVRLAQDMGLR